MSEKLRFLAEVDTVFIEDGFDPAYFVTLPDNAAALVAQYRLATGKRGGFGSGRVKARIGESRWGTTLNSKAGNWTLPIKKPVRVEQALERGQRVDVEFALP